MTRRPLIFVSWQHFDNVSSLVRLNWRFVVHVTLTFSSELLVLRHFMADYMHSYRTLSAMLAIFVGVLSIVDV